MIAYESTGNVIDNTYELTITEGSYAGVSFIYEDIKIPEGENSDGTMTLTFGYKITNGMKVDENFKTVLGDLIIQILDKQLDHNEVVYHGGI